MMHKRLAVITALLSLVVAGCGSAPVKPKPATGPASTRCSEGVMGGCITPHTHRLTAPRLTGTLIPDVSEYQGCALYSAAIFRVYEAGTGREDTRAGCHARELKRLHAWSAAYAFLRPGDCAGEARRTLEIVKGLGGVTGPIVADAEVPLPRGFVRCFNHVIRAAGYPAVTYTSPGTHSGGPLEAPIWGADYGAELPCIEGVCRFVAHQFSSAFNCRGVYGDCSIDSGLLAIVRHAGPSRASKIRSLHRHEHLRRLLHGDLERHHCRRGQHATPRQPLRIRRRVHNILCPRWTARGARTIRVINRLHREGIR